MAKLLIRTEDEEVIEVQGRMTFEVARTDEGGLVTYGQLSMHKYIPDICGIESIRYKLDTVEVIKETFGTNDFNILYDFILTDEEAFEVKEEVLEDFEIHMLEQKEYGKDESKAWEDREWKSETN